MPYDCTNTLRFALAHCLRSEYLQDPADYSGLFQTDSLRYWLSTGRSAESILREVAGLKREQAIGPRKASA